jgi:hypothetical protein
VRRGGGCQRSEHSIGVDDDLGAEDALEAGGGADTLR